MKQRMLSLLEELFEAPEGSFVGDETLTDLNGWSSLTFVALIAMVDEEFGVTLSPKDVLEVGSLTDLIGLVEGESASQQAA